MNEFENERAPRTPGELSNFQRKLKLCYILQNYLINVNHPLYAAYNYVDAPGHEKHWLVRTQPRPFNQTAADEIDR